MPLGDIPGGIFLSSGEEEENTRYPLVDSVKEGANSEPWPLDEASKPIPMPEDKMIDGRIFDSENLESYFEGLPVL